MDSKDSSCTLICDLWKSFNLLLTVTTTPCIPGNQHWCIMLLILYAKITTTPFPLVHLYIYRENQPTPRFPSSSFLYPWVTHYSSSDTSTSATCLIHVNILLLLEVLSSMSPTSQILHASHQYRVALLWWCPAMIRLDRGRGGMEAKQREAETQAVDKREGEELMTSIYIGL